MVIHTTELCDPFPFIPVHPLTRIYFAVVLRTNSYSPSPQASIHKLFLSNSPCVSHVTSQHVARRPTTFVMVPKFQYPQNCLVWNAAGSRARSRLLGHAGSVQTYCHPCWLSLPHQKKGTENLILRSSLVIIVASLRFRDVCIFIIHQKFTLTDSQCYWSGKSRDLLQLFKVALSLYSFSLFEFINDEWGRLHFFISCN